VIRLNCKFINEDGEPCEAFAIKGSDYCWFHDPDKLEERIEACKKGGKVGTREVLPESNVKINSLKDIVRLLESTINDVRTGQIDVRIANSVAYLSGVLRQVMEQEFLEKRLDSLEKKVERVNRLKNLS
jgi:hypothetical protein